MENVNMHHQAELKNHKNAILAKMLIFACIIIACLGFIVEMSPYRAETGIESSHEADDVAKRWDLNLDPESLECIDPEPSKGTVGAGLSFTQMRTCNVRAVTRKCFDYRGELVCADRNVSVTVSNTEIGSKIISDQ